MSKSILGQVPVANSVVPFPGFEELKDAVEKLRAELSMLLLERDELLYMECKNIEAAYMLAVGGLEYKAYEIECVILRLKRKLELIQAKLNRQEKVILSEIEERLDNEFSEYRIKPASKCHREDRGYKIRVPLHHEISPSEPRKSRGSKGPT